ncbi:MAG: class B sortase [Oscillospiraceae bacterium]|nr:class B sortase [Oscillospiraceae bacterium]
MSGSGKENIFVRIAHYLFPQKGDEGKEVVRKIIFLAAAVVLIVTGTILITDNVRRMKTNKDDDDRANDFHNQSIIVSAPVESTSEPVESAVDKPKVERPVQAQFETLLQQNPETIGWITIQDTKVDYVVVQGEDNDKYLTTTFTGGYAKSGTLFVDYMDKITPYDEPDNIVIYGHNMATGEYFAPLINYFNWENGHNHDDLSFYKAHPTIEFNSLYKNSTYKIFAVMMLNVYEDAGEVFNYHVKHNFRDQDDFNEYVAEILDRSTFYNPDVNVQYGDKLITLSTCKFGSYGTQDLRLVVFGREVREGESSEVDVSKAYSNPNPKFYDMYDKTFNHKWEGRKWDKKLLVGYED